MNPVMIEWQTLVEGVKKGKVKGSLDVGWYLEEMTKAIELIDATLERIEKKEMLFRQQGDEGQQVRYLEKARPKLVAAGEELLAAREDGSIKAESGKGVPKSWEANQRSYVKWRDEYAALAKKAAEDAAARFGRPTLKPPRPT